MIQNVFIKKTVRVEKGFFYNLKKKLNLTKGKISRFRFLKAQSAYLTEN